MNPNVHLLIKDTLNIKHLLLILDYVSLPELLTKVLATNKRVKLAISEQNYFVLKMFIRYFNIHWRFKRTDIASFADMVRLCQENIKILQNKTSAKLFNPFAYYCDGGTYNDDHTYFIHHIFSTSNVCYSTKKGTDSNVQFILYRKAQIQQGQITPKQWFPEPGNNHKIRVPVNEFYTEENEPETFKIIKDITIYLRGWGYTCFITHFALFISDQEVDCDNSQTIKAFSKINSIQELEKLNLPEAQRNQFQSGQKQSSLIEFDLS